MKPFSQDPFYQATWSPAIQEGCIRLSWQAPQQMPTRLIKDVLRHELGCSGTVIQRLRQPGLLLVDGRPARVLDHIGAGCLLEVWLSEPDDSGLQPEDLPLAVLYEDAHLLAVDKPDNQPVHPSSLHRGGTLANAVAWHLAQHGEGRRIHPVTRLDRNTAGITLFAKTAHAQHALTRLAEAGHFHKEYLAIATGILTPPTGTIRLPIRRKAASIIERETHPEGDPSVTHYEVLATFFLAGYGQGAAPLGCSLVRIRLETGRTHQIRVHCQALGHPLLGDTLYGGPAHAPLSGQALVCDRLSFPHPVTGEQVEIRSGRDFPMFSLISGEWLST